MIKSLSDNPSTLAQKMGMRIDEKINKNRQHIE